MTTVGFVAAVALNRMSAVDSNNLDGCTAPQTPLFAQATSKSVLVHSHFPLCPGLAMTTGWFGSRLCDVAETAYNKCCEPQPAIQEPPGQSSLKPRMRARRSQTPSGPSTPSSSKLQKAGLPFILVSFPTSIHTHTQR